MKLTRPLILVAALAAALAGAALAGVVAHKGATVKTINVTEKEFHITLSSRKGVVGSVRFAIKNTGKHSHALAISGPGVKLKKTDPHGHPQGRDLRPLVPGARPCRAGHEDLDHRAGIHDGWLGWRRNHVDARYHHRR